MSDIDFLSGFVSLNKHTEIPPIFALWSGIAGISCALGRRVWVDMGRYQIFPNEYVLLVAGSGRMRKSTSIHQIEKILNHVEPHPNIVSQKVTPQAFIEAVQGGIVTTGSIITETCTAFGIISEMATFLDKNAYEAGLAPILIDFFDCLDKWEYRTKGRGIEQLRNICFGFLAASTIDWIRKGIPTEAIGGGLTSRIIFVYAQFDAAVMKPVAMTVYTDEDKKLMDLLVRKLMRIGTITGQAVVTQEAIDFYVESYNDWFYTTGQKYYEDPMLAGYASRRYIHMFKLGLIFAAASESLDERNRLVIKRFHLEGAIEALKVCETHLTAVMSQITTNEHGDEIKAVQTYVKRVKCVTRTEIMKNFSHRMNSRELSDILETLTHAGRIRLVSEGNSVMYASTD